MKTFFLSTLFSLVLIFNCHSQNWRWARSANGGGQGSSICADAVGNVYVTGSFGNSIVFGNSVLTNSGGSNVYITKYDHEGNVMWAKNIGGQRSSSICASNDGNIYVTGWFNNPTITIGTTTFINAGGSNPGSAGGPGSPCTDMYIAKCDSSGNVLWAKSIGGTGNELANSVTTDANGNVIVTGSFESTSINLGTIVLANSNSSGQTRNLFITKYDSAGNVLWAKSAEGDGGSSISADAAGNIFVTGEFWGNITFGSTILTTAISDAFIVKFDENGNVVWAKNPALTSRAGGYSVSSDTEGNVFVAGWFSSPSITFGATVLTGNGQGSDPFIAKYDSNGNALWAKSSSGTNGFNDYCHSVCTSIAGDIYVTGYFEASTPSISFGALTLTPPSGADFPIFIVKYDAKGREVSASALASGGRACTQVNVDASGNAYVAGTFNINPFAVGSDTLSLSGGENVFVANYQGNEGIATSISKKEENEMSLTVFPNPSAGVFTVNLKSTNPRTSIRVNDVLGNRVLEETSLKNLTREIDLTNYPKGIYFVEIASENTRAVKKIIVQ